MRPAGRGLKTPGVEYKESWALLQIFHSVMTTELYLIKIFRYPIIFYNKSNGLGTSYAVLEHQVN